MSDPYSDFSSPAPTSPFGGLDAARQALPDPYAAFSSPAAAHDGFEGGANAAASGFASGVPVVGPAFNAALDRGVAGIEALSTGRPYGDLLAANQAQEQADNAAHPTANKVAGIAGAIAGTAPLIAAAPAAFGAEGGALTLGQVARGAASGAGLGGADAAVRSGLDPRATAQGAAFGAAGGAAAPVVGKAIGAAAGALFPRQAAAPTADALRAASGADYAAARGLGVHYTSDAVSGMAQNVQAGLNDQGILPILAPKTHSILGQLASPPAGATVPFGGLEGARRAFGHAAKDFANPTEQKAASTAISAIDDLFAAGDPRTVAHGTPDDVANLAGLARNARANWAAAARSDQLAGVGDAADMRASAANSGQNIGNATRQRVASLLLNSKKSSGYTDEELAALRAVVEGTPYQNTTRYLGNLFGGGGGLGGMVGSFIGAHAAGPGGAVVAPGVGMIAKKLSNASTVSMLDRIVADTARRSPLFAQMSAAAPAASDATAAPAVATSIPMLARLLQMQGAAQPDYAYK